MAVPLGPILMLLACVVGARKSKDGPQARRLLALAAIYEGASRTEGGQDWRGDASRSFAIGCSSSTPMVRRV